MEFLAYAKEIELQSMKFYTELAHQITDKELSGIFIFLSDQEKQHYEIFNSWQKKLLTQELLTSTNILKQANSTFKKLSKHYNTIEIPVNNRDEVYLKALEVENKSINLLTLAIETSKESKINIEIENQNSLLKQIIVQEKYHAELIVSLMEFQRHPYELA